MINVSISLAITINVLIFKHKNDRTIADMANDSAHDSARILSSQRHVAEQEVKMHNAPVL